jgi:hypothetical protein
MSELNSKGACPGEAEAPPPDSYARSLKSNGVKYRRKNRLNTELLQAVYEGNEDNVIRSIYSTSVINPSLFLRCVVNARGHAAFATASPPGGG